MDQWGSIDDVLDFAIDNEQQAVDFYTDLAARSDEPWMRKVFESFAAEEKGHRAQLTAVRKGRREFGAPEKIQDLKIADYLADVQNEADFDYRKALIVAMKQEQAAFRLYSDLAALAQTDELRQTFQALAQEEAKHKLRFETEYDDEVLKEN